MKKKYDFFANKKINYTELADEIKAEVGVLGGLDIFTNAHVLGVADITYKICTEMQMPYERLKYCVLGAYLHDVGKIYIPSEILQKEGALSEEEFEVMKKHTTYGYEICSQYRQFSNLAPIARWHHESFDGSGYPDGLNESEIPYEVSLIKVADVYDALSRRRQYKDGYAQSKTIEIMIEEVKNNRMCAQFLYYLVSYLIKEIDEKIEFALKSVNKYKEEIELLHDLESIYKEIYDKGYTDKLKRKLQRYELEPGYDMSANAQLLSSKQKVYEKETEKYNFLMEEREILTKQLKELKELYKNEIFYKDV